VSRVARSALTFAISTIASVIGVVASFVATPIVVHYLGAERLGAFRATSEWAGYLSLFEVAIAGALAPLIVQAASAGPDKLGGILAAGVRAYLRVTFWTILAAIGLWIALPELIRLPAELESEFRIGFGFAVAATVFLPLGIFRSLADALQKGYLISALLGLQAVTIAFGCALAAYSGWGLIGQFGASVAGGLIAPIGLWILLRKSVPDRSNAVHAETGDAANRLGQLNRTTLLFQLIGRVCLFTDNIVIGLFLGPAAVASFFLTTRLPQAMCSQVQTLGGATWAGLAELHHSGQHELFRRRLTELTRLTAMLSGALVVPLAALTGPFIGLWVGPEYYAGDWVVGLAVLNGVMLPVFGLWGWVFSGVGRVGVLIRYMIWQGILNLAASLLATYFLGVTGPLLGTAFVNLFYNPWALGRLLRHEFGISLIGVFGAMLTPLMPAAIVLVGLYIARELWPDYSWWMWIAEFAAGSGIYLTSCWLLITGENERTTLRQLGHRLMGNIR